MPGVTLAQSERSGPGCQRASREALVATSGGASESWSEGSPEEVWEVQRGRSLRNVPRRLRSLEDSLSGEGGGDIRGQNSIGVPPASSPRTPCLRVCFHCLHRSG
eukprot:6338840-Pyramimonas_sp.AAC.1